MKSFKGCEHRWIKANHGDPENLSVWVNGVPKVIVNEVCECGLCRSYLLDSVGAKTPVAGTIQVYYPGDWRHCRQAVAELRRDRHRTYQDWENDTTAVIYRRKSGRWSITRLSVGKNGACNHEWFASRRAAIAELRRMGYVYGYRTYLRPNGDRVLIY